MRDISVLNFRPFTLFQGSIKEHLLLTSMKTRTLSHTLLEEAKPKLRAFDFHLIFFDFQSHHLSVLQTEAGEIQAAEFRHCTP